MQKSRSPRKQHTETTGIEMHQSQRSSISSGNDAIYRHHKRPYSQTNDIKSEINFVH